MARISIYVSENLKARMDAVGDRVNWSDVAQVAFEKAVAAYEQKRGDNMETAIERLRASKQEGAQDDFFLGRTIGQEWAIKSAEHKELVRLSRIIFPNQDYRQAEDLLMRAVNPSNEYTKEEIYESCFGDDEDVSEEFIAGFIEGAKDFYEEHKNEI